jgi:hypothetical protein
MKMRSTDPRATVVTYAFFHAFKFPDSMAVHIRCKVRLSAKQGVNPRDGSGSGLSPTFSFI